MPPTPSMISLSKQRMYNEFNRYPREHVPMRSPRPIPSDHPGNHDRIRSNYLRNATLGKTWRDSSNSYIFSWKDHDASGIAIGGHCANYDFEMRVGAPEHPTARPGPIRLRLGSSEAKCNMATQGIKEKPSPPPPPPPRKSLRCRWKRPFGSWATGPNLSQGFPNMRSKGATLPPLAAFASFGPLCLEPPLFHEILTA